MLRKWVAALSVTLALAGTARALDTVFTNGSGGSTQQIKVCALMLQSNQWENSEPFVLPALAGVGVPIPEVTALRPSNWQLVNPLAPAYVTQDIANLWNYSYNGQVAFDGLSATVRNNQYNDAPNTTTGDAKYQSASPMVYLAHCWPHYLGQYGVGGTLSALPAVGQPIPMSHPAYWEVPLTSRTVSQLASFDVVLLNTQRAINFSAQELQLLQQFLDMGGTLYLENSHGLRLAPVAGGKPENPADVNFLFKVQFCDGYPKYGTPKYRTDPIGAPYKYPLNDGGTSGVVPVATPAWTASNLGHPLLSLIAPLAASEIQLLGDVRSVDQLMLRNSPGNYLAETVLQTTWTADWNPNKDEPAVAVAHVGSGKLIMSGIDIMQDVDYAYNQAMQADYLPNIKFMLNVLGWTGVYGGNRRGGPTNQGVTAKSALRSLAQRFVWNAPSGGLGTPANIGNGSIDVPTATYPSLNSDPFTGLSEPLCEANGVVYVQYRSSSTGDTYVAALDTNPGTDRDGDGVVDDGTIRDMETWGAPFDTLWVKDVGAYPVLGGTVASINHIAKQKPFDVLFITQRVGTDTVRVSALTATVDKTLLATAPADVPGGPFYNWTTACNGGANTYWQPTNGGNGYVDLKVAGTVLDPSATSSPVRKPASTPVVYGDTLYITLAFTPQTIAGAGAADGEWVQVVALRMVPDSYPTPSATGAAGMIKWAYPDPTYGAEVPPTLTSITTMGQWLQFGAMKQVDPTAQFGASGSGGLLYVAAAVGGGSQFDPSGTGSQALNVVPCANDLANLTPVVGQARDSRTGLTATTVFLNRANGDVWAVAGGDEATGWRLPTWATSGTVSINGTTVTGAQWTYEKDANDKVVATNVTIPPAVWRAAVSYNGNGFAANSYVTASLQYVATDGTKTANITESRPIYPLSRLLRAERDSGLNGVNGAADLLTYSTAAPMLFDSTTVVSASLPLWNGPNRYSGAAGDVKGSGPVSFFDAGGETQDPGALNPNTGTALRWQFDPGVLLAGAQQYFGASGSPVKYGNAVVVAGTVFNLANGTDRKNDTGAVFALDPNPSFVTTLTGTSNAPSYLVAPPPGGLASLTDNYVGCVNAGGDSLSSMYHAVVDPSQYTFDPYSKTLSLTSEWAHVAKLAHPYVGSPANGPTCWRLPLYGRQLYLAQDTNGDGRADNVVPVYFPLPVKWCWTPDMLVLDTPDWIPNASTPTLTYTKSDGTQGSYTPVQVDKTNRPWLLYVNPTAGLRGQQVTVSYTSASGARSETYTVPGDLPGISFAPTVGGDRLYFSGTQLPSWYDLKNNTGNNLGAARTGVTGLHSLGLSGLSKALAHDTLAPATALTWSNPFPATGTTTWDQTMLRGAPLVTDDGLFASFALRSGTTWVTPLYCLGNSELTVTDSLRISKMGYDGFVSWQLTGVQTQNGAARPVQQLTFNPNPDALLTSALSRPTRAYPLTGGDVLVVDTGNDRVVQVNTTGVATWPLDSQLSGTQLLYRGLRNFGLLRPSDAVRFTVSAGPYVGRDLTAIADKGNRRVLLVSSHNQTAGGATQTVYDALTGQYTDNAGGLGIPLTAAKVYNPVTRAWVDLPYAELQDWVPAVGEPVNTGEAAWDGTDLGRYLVTRVEGLDQLLNVDLFANHDGVVDSTATGVAGGLKTNLALMADRWSQGATFRGLRAFRRFKVGAQSYLAVVSQDDSGFGSRVAVYQLDTGSVFPANSLDGLPGTHLRYLNPAAGTTSGTPWSFGVADYQSQVYDPGNAVSASYYGRVSNALWPTGVSQTQRSAWWSGGSKAWNPVAVSKLPTDNVLVVTNGAADALNQSASNSEVLLVRFDPRELTNKQVLNILPDLASTASYPAGQAASQNRPTTGSYPVSCPVWATP